MPITSPLLTLDPVDPATTTVATTSVRFVHRPTITVRTIGKGRVITTGITDVGSLERHPTLGVFLRRLLHTGFGPKHTERPRGRDRRLRPLRRDGLPAWSRRHRNRGAWRWWRPPTALRNDSRRPGRISRDCTPTPTARSLAADPDVDVAIVATPPAHHAALALELLRAGKHVVIEKPMCLRTDDADLLIRTAAEVDRVVTVHQSRRWDQDWLAVRRVLHQGGLGEVFNIETFVGGFEHPCRAWHSEDSISGGAVYDWGSHHVDWIIQQYGSAPQRVLCTTHSRVWLDTSNVDQLSLWMQWADGREATFRQSESAPSAAPSSISRAPRALSKATTDR